ncbi:MAG: hypothetical protein K2H16_09015, partial [Prevotella sp.]|nr:hypothetical protein [Prevotella sp.]
STGALKSDTGRGIALIEYDQWDNPRRVQFTNGNVTEYIYTATGEKLRTVHYTAMPNITVEHDVRHDLTHGLNTYDYGARQYYSVLLRWDRLDPLCEKYYHASPYVYCMNNPVNAIDQDGRKIVDANGRQMVYYNNKGHIKFTKYANNDVRTLVKCLGLTKTGMAMLSQMIKSDIKVHFQISDKTVMSGKTITYGETIQGNMDKSDDYGKTADGKSIKEATITIFSGSIKESIKKGSGLKHEGLTEEQAVGAVIGHEAVHGTNKKRYRQTFDLREKER